MSQVSKSDYMLFLRHPAWLWVKKNDPKKIPPIDENTQALFDSGHQFEPYAELQFPEGVTLGFSDYSEYLSLPRRTQDAIARGDKVLFQPRFEWDGFTLSTSPNSRHLVSSQLFSRQLGADVLDIECRI